MKRFRVEINISNFPASGHTAIAIYIDANSHMDASKAANYMFGASSSIQSVEEVQQWSEGKTIPIHVYPISTGDLATPMIQIPILEQLRKQIQHLSEDFKRFNNQPKSADPINSQNSTFKEAIKLLSECNRLLMNHHNMTNVEQLLHGNGVCQLCRDAEIFVRLSKFVEWNS